MTGTAVAAGAALGCLYTIAVLTREQLSLPSGPSFALLPIAGIVGAAAGALVAAAGAAGGAPAILFTRSRSMGATGILAAAGSWLSERRQARTSGTSGSTPTPYD